MKNPEQYKDRLKRLGLLIENRAPAGVIVVDCWLVIRSYGLLDVLWARITSFVNWFWFVKIGG